MAPPAQQKAIILGISGCSSSGKTTLSRLLRDIFPRTFILHEDDFYLPEDQLPKRHGFSDWDCPEALDIPAIAKSLEYIQHEGCSPPELVSKEDRNTVDQVPVSQELIAALAARVAAWCQPGQPGHPFAARTDLRFCIFDGFLLFSPHLASVQPFMDIRLFLRASYERAVGRRQARSGYVTIEGFWEDPPGYVEQIVWPNYVADHKWMFERDDVEGAYKPDVLKEWDIEAIQDKGPDVDMETTLTWAVETIMARLEKLVH